jgi:hypothetical protein
MCFDTSAWLSRARALIGEANVLCADNGDDLSAYTKDWRNKFQGQALAVLRPASNRRFDCSARR